MTDFKILTDAEHVLTRPSMYIGSTSEEEVSGFISGTWETKKVVPGLLKIINEIIDNSLDEFIRTQGKFANVIEVTFQEDVYGDYVEVSDNGRGIPVIKHEGLYQAELCWTRAKAGTNFSDDGRITVGMNGVGSFCTNVFSTEFNGLSSDGKTAVVVSCKNNASEVHTKTVASTKRGTSVRFVPDLPRFNLSSITDDHKEMIHDRLFNLSICYPGIKFVLTYAKGGKVETFKIQSPKTSELGKLFHPDAIVDSTDNFSVVFAPVGEAQEFRHLCYLNGLNIKNGGSHVDYMMWAICNELQPQIKKKWKIDVLPAQIKNQLIMASWSRNFQNPKFDSQTKERLTNTVSEVKQYFGGFDYAKLAKKIITTPAIIDPIIEAILYRKELAERLALARQAKSAKKLKIANHIQANSKNPEEKTLFITEGLSAIGPLIAVRDANKVGGYSLKGKVMNTRDMKPVDIIKNKELSELMAVLGLEFNREPDLNYGRIAIMTDMDVDGSAIFALLLNFFSNWPSLFTDGRIYRVMSPRYIVSKGKARSVYYNDAEYTKAKVPAGSDVSYIKGLGTLKKEDYREIINNPRLIRVTMNEEDAKSLEMAFGGNADMRKEWLLNG